MRLAELHKEDLHRCLTEEHFDAFIYDELLYLPHALIEVFAWAEKGDSIVLDQLEIQLNELMLEAENSVYEEADLKADEEFLEAVFEDALAFTLSADYCVLVENRMESCPSFKYSLTVLDEIFVECLGKGNGSPQDDLTQTEKHLFYLAKDRPGFDLVKFILTCNLSQILRQELEVSFGQMGDRLERVLSVDDSLESWKELTGSELCLLGLVKVENQMRVLDEIQAYLTQHPEAKKIDIKSERVNIFWIKPRKTVLESYHQKFSQFLEEYNQAVERGDRDLPRPNREDLITDLRLIERNNYWPVFAKLRGE